jgi:hypothetical protein
MSRDGFRIDQKAQARVLRRLWRLFDNSTVYACAQRKTQYDDSKCRQSWASYIAELDRQFPPTGELRVLNPFREYD